MALGQSDARADYDQPQELTDRCILSQKRNTGGESDGGNDVVDYRQESRPAIRHHPEIDPGREAGREDSSNVSDSSTKDAK